MSYHAVGAEQDPFKLFESKLSELRQGKAEEDAGRRPPAPKPDINWWCWDHPGFKPCYGGPAWRAAQADCEATGHRDELACIQPLVDRYSQACPCPASPPSTLLTAMTGNTWLTIGIAIAGAYVMFGMPKKKAKAA